MTTSRMADLEFDADVTLLLISSCDRRRICPTTHIDATMLALRCTGGIKRCCDQSVRLSVRLSHTSILAGRRGRMYLAQAACALRTCVIYNVCCRCRTATGDMHNRFALVQAILCLSTDDFFGLAA